MLFDIKEARKGIEHEYIGFSPNTTNVKPVHLANGMFRRLLGETNNTKRLFQFVFSAKHDGIVPAGHELDKVYQWLIDEERISEGDVSLHSVSQFRSTLLKVVAADKPSAVSTGGMESYSAGFSSFVSKDRIAQDAGEFLGLWLSKQSPEFAELLIGSIREDNDPITILAKPLFGSSEAAKMQIETVDSIRCFKDTCSPHVSMGMQKLATAAVQLSQQLKHHPNKLVRLRMAVMAGAFLLVRYMADLEYLFVTTVDHRRPAFLLDFSTSERSPMRLASQHSYILVCQSVTRFYAWMFADYLRSRFSADDLLQDYPAYDPLKKNKNGKTKNPNDICREVWQEAMDRAQNEQDSYPVYGQAVYDILALLPEATPIQYLRNIGIRCGLFWPPYNLQPTKYLTPRQDMLEVLIRSVVSSGDVLDIITLQNRLWDIFGIVVGGRPDDLNILIERGIYQADDKALEENQIAFMQKLSDLNFARLLADGVLEIQVG